MPVDGTVGEGNPRQLRIINANINAAIVPRDDPTKPWELHPRMGACGDYAISKRHDLLKAGWSSSHLLLAEVVLRGSGKHHLVLVARSGAETWVLDNLSDRLISIDEMRRRYIVIRAQSVDDPQIWETSLLPEHVAAAP